MNRVALHALVALGGYAAIALWLTRPLVWHLADHALAAHALTDYDVPFNVWVLSWVARALATAPLRLFEANIYHPAPDALAYAEHWLGTMPFFAPTYLASGNPVLAVNVMMLSGLVLSAAAAHLVAWRWTGSLAAAVTAGVLFGFFPAHVRPLGPSLVTLQYLPIVLLGLDAVLAGAGAGATMLLTIALLGQCLASLYFAYPTLLATMAATIALCFWRGARPSGAALLRVGGAVAVAACALALLARPYFRVAARGLETMYGFLAAALDRPIAAVDLLTASGRALGGAAVVLAVGGVVLGLGRGGGASTQRRIVLLLVWLAVGHVLYAGPTVEVGDIALPMPSRLLAEIAPGFAVLRDRDRLFVVALVATTLLAAFGVAGLAGLARTIGARRALGAGVAAAALVGTAVFMDLGPCRLLALPTGARVPAVYRALAGGGAGPVLELPIGVRTQDLDAARLNARYEYFSIYHRRPLLNGYTSFWPPQYEMIAAMARALPASRALARLVGCTGLRSVVVHTAQLSPADAERWTDPGPGWIAAGRFDGDLLFDLDPALGEGGCGRGLFTDTATTTLDGTPRAPLAPDVRHAIVEAVAIPGEIAYDLAHVGPMMSVALEARVRVRNPSPRPWPALATGSAGLVRLSYRWRDRTGRVRKLPPPLSTPLPFDLGPGETIDLPVAFHLPLFPGEYWFETVVEQEGAGTFETSGPGAAPSPVRIVKRSPQ